MTKLNIPDWLSVVLGLVAGVLEYFNQVSFHLTAPWAQVVTFGLYAVAIIGVSPLTHAAFRNALHLTPAAATAITVAATILAAAITTFSGMSADVKGVLEGVLAFLAFIGFGAGPVPPLPA